MFNKKKPRKSEIKKKDNLDDDNTDQAEPSTESPNKNTTVRNVRFPPVAEEDVNCKTVSSHNQNKKQALDLQN